MQFEKYQHVEKLGSVEVEGILDGIVHIFPKLDGTCTSVYLNDNGEVEVASRNRVLSVDNDNAGVCAYVKSQDKFRRYLDKYPNHRLFGEWLVPHHIRTYESTAWRKLYIFDVMSLQDSGEEVYLEYEIYAEMLAEFFIDYIPCIDWISNPTYGTIHIYEDKCTFLMQDGQIGEGIVIKNYDFVNRFGRTTWAKIVRPQAKVAIKNHKPVTADNVEWAIVEKFVTPELVNKEYSKIACDNCGYFAKRDIPKLLEMVWYCLISEEMINILRKFKNPTIDFALMKKLCTERVKEIKAEIFNG